jgi:hypothetical protein
MKKLIVALVLTGMLFSCKKENTPLEDQQVKRPVTIRIPDFTTSRENFRVNADSSLAGITDLYYFSYTNNGVLVHEMHQDSTDPNFGTFTDSLVPGNYWVAVIASQQPLVMHTPGTILNHYFDPGQASVDAWNPYKDVFHNTLAITVPASGNSVVTDISLHRIIGKVELKILDALPANHVNGFIDAYFVNPPAEVYIEGGTARIPSIPMTSKLTRRGQSLFEAYMFGIDDSFDLRIDYKDKNTGALLQKVIPTILIWQNQKTIIQGYLYGAPGNAGFQVKLNQAWGTDSTVVNFN